MARRRSFASRRLRSMLVDFGKLNVWPLLALVGVYLAAVAAGHVLGGWGYTQGFVDGSLLALLLGVVWTLFLVHTDGLAKLAGVLGERRTREELDRARKRGHVWGAVHNVEVDGPDIDSVVLAPGGVLAIESKWGTRPLTSYWLSRYISQARDGAAKTRSILRSKSAVNEVHEVTPVLVLWGRLAELVPAGGVEREDVHVLDGNELVAWLSGRTTDRLSKADATRVLNSLEAFARSHHRGPEI